MFIFFLFFFTNNFINGNTQVKDEVLDLFKKNIFLYIADDDFVKDFNLFISFYKLDIICLGKKNFNNKSIYIYTLEKNKNLFYENENKNKNKNLNIEIVCKNNSLKNHFIKIKEINEDNSKIENLDQNETKCICLKNFEKNLNNLFLNEKQFCKLFFEKKFVLPKIENISTFNVVNKSFNQSFDESKFENFASIEIEETDDFSFSKHEQNQINDNYMNFTEININKNEIVYETNSENNVKFNENNFNKNIDEMNNENDDETEIEEEILYNSNILDDLNQTQKQMKIIKVKKKTNKKKSIIFSITIIIYMISGEFLKKKKEED